MGRLVLKFNVCYSADARKAAAILLECARATPRLRTPAPKAVLEGLAEKWIEFSLRVYLADINEALDVQSELRISALESLRAAGIDIPARNLGGGTGRLAWADAAKRAGDAREPMAGVPAGAPACPSWSATRADARKPTLGPRPTVRPLPASTPARTLCCYGAPACAARSSRKTPRPKSRENGDGPRARHQPPPGKFMAAMTGGDAVPRWAWLVAAILLLIPVFAIYKIVETRAALNTAEAGRQSALNALASTEAALAAATSSSPISSPRRRTPIPSCRRPCSRGRSWKPTCVRRARSSARRGSSSPPWRRRPGPQEQIRAAKAELQASGARAEGGERAARGNGTRREGRKGRRRRRRARRRRRRSCRCGSRARRKGDCGSRQRSRARSRPRPRARKADRRDERVERGSAAVRGILGELETLRKAGQSRAARGAAASEAPARPPGTRATGPSRRDAAAVAEAAGELLRLQACSCE